MLLEPLVSTIRTVRERMQQHNQALRQSEALTRYALIDPVLRALGWNTEDPALVVPEYRAAGGFADYALMGPSRPVSLLEAKKLGENLTSGIGQALNYCNEQGINYMLVSDGNAWVMYEVFRQAPIEERRMVSISIKDDSIHQAALKLLLLWHTNLETGEPAVANAPVFDQLSDLTTDDNSPPQPTPNPDPPGNWISLSTVVAGKGTSPPKGIRFPGREPRGITSWWQVLSEVTEKLANDGKLLAEDCPIAGLGFVNSSAAGTGGGTSGRYKSVSGGLFVNVNWKASNIIKHSNKLLTHFGVNPETVELRFE